MSGSNISDQQQRLSIPNVSWDYCRLNQFLRYDSGKRTKQIIVTLHEDIACGLIIKYFWALFGIGEGWRDGGIDLLRD